jgi:hypothetical protein
MKISLSRRSFIARITIIGIASATRARAQTSGRRSPLRHGVIGIGIGDRTPSDARAMGLSLGVDEASHAASLFGGSIALAPVTARTTGLSAIITASCDVSAHDVPHLNVSCTDDSFRRRCDRRLFHVAPSDAMRRDAAVGHHGEIVAWHPSLVRFGADTLNQRFLKHFGHPMTADAWTAWFAIKVLWEASLRTTSVEPRLLADFLSRDSTQFDGHKGKPLSFRSWDRQLRQPLYVVDAGRVLEVPAAAPGDSSTRAILDKLGDHASDACAR